MPAIPRLGTGTRRSQAVIHGGIVHLAGQVARPGRPVAEPTEGVLAGIDRLLALAGTDKTRILTARIWLADMASFDEMNAVRDAREPAGHAPAHAAGEARQAMPGYLVKIIVTAALP
jgi:enamine deaminase RidA (YjgF/YER057c/UK114 family)